MPKLNPLTNLNLQPPKKLTRYYCDNCEYEFLATEDEVQLYSWKYTKPCSLCKGDMERKPKRNIELVVIEDLKFITNERRLRYQKWHLKK